MVMLWPLPLVTSPPISHNHDNLFCFFLNRNTSLCRSLLSRAICQDSRCNVSWSLCVVVFKVEYLTTFSSHKCFQQIEVILEKVKAFWLGHVFSCENFQHSLTVVFFKSVVTERTYFHTLYSIYVCLLGNWYTHIIKYFFLFFVGVLTKVVRNIRT